MWSRDRANPSFQYACIKNEYGFKQSMFPRARLAASEMRVQWSDYLISAMYRVSTIQKELLIMHPHGYRKSLLQGQATSLLHLQGMATWIGNRCLPQHKI